MGRFPAPSHERRRTMAARYFFAQGATEHGPYSADQMRELAIGGQIQPTDSIWQEGLQQRYPASCVKNLFQEPSAPADPVATSAAAPAEAAPADTDNAEGSAE